MAKKILVLGSSNTDMVIRSSNLPRAGETIVGGSFLMNPGGKGANQAVAAAKVGGDVIFITKIGKDVFGNEAKRSLEKVGINTDYVIVDTHHASGIALIMVDENGENCISVALGANENLTTDDLGNLESLLDEVSYLLVQLEIPVETVANAIELAKLKGVEVILNPAPAATLPQYVFTQLDYITPNETETELLTGIQVNDIDSARSAAQILRKKGVKNVIITMGSQGVYVQNNELDKMFPSITVKAVDTTAAGDTFNGTFCTGLSEGMNLESAISFANTAAALSVTRMGAQSSIPSRAQIDNLKI